MTLRNQLLAHKAQIKPITLMGETYYVKPMTVGEINHQVFEQRQTLIELAKADGVELPAEEGEAYDDALTKFAKKYGLLVRWLLVSAMKRATYYLMPIVWMT